jgi:hypothetical protein
MPIVPTVGLGSASGYPVLAASTVTSTGATAITGKLGLSPGTSVTGFPPGTVTGAQDIANAAAAQAQLDLTTAFNDAANRSGGTLIVGDLGGQTLPPGVYKSNSSVGLTGVLTLDAQGNAAAVWIFQIPSTLTVANAASVVLANGALAANVFWQVGSSATIGTTATMLGTIMAQASVTINTGATLSGRAMARTGAVTLQANTITNTFTAGGTNGASGCFIATPVITGSQIPPPGQPQYKSWLISCCDTDTGFSFPHGFLQFGITGGVSVQPDFVNGTVIPSTANAALANWGITADANNIILVKQSATGSGGTNVLKVVAGRPHTILQ